MKIIHCLAVAAFVTSLGSCEGRMRRRCKTLKSMLDRPCTRKPRSTTRRPVPRLVPPPPTKMPTRFPTTPIPTNIPAFSPFGTMSNPIPPRPRSPTRPPTSTPTNVPSSSPSNSPSKGTTDLPTISPAPVFPATCAGVPVKKFGGHWYGLLLTPMTWSNADAYFKNYSCCGATGHLLSINSEAEKAFVENQLLDKQCGWTGLNDAQTEGTFVWTSDEPYNTILPFSRPNTEEADYVYVCHFDSVSYNLASTFASAYSLFEFDCKK